MSELDRDLRESLDAIFDIALLNSLLQSEAQKHPTILKTIKEIHNG